jgi:lactate racemase
MDCLLKYGRTKISLHETKITALVEPKELPGLTDPGTEVRRFLQHPIGSKPLGQLVQEQNPQKVAIIINDITRPTPYGVILPSLLEELHGAGLAKNQIKFYIATGIHDPNTHEQNLHTFGAEILENYEVVSHDPDHNLVDLGQLPSGNTLFVNNAVYESDLIITTGVINLHYFAGFSGGRKSILPGVSGRTTIQNNHQAMVHLIAEEPPIDQNPVSLEMIEAARRIGVDFIVNVVTNSKKEIVQVVAGELVEAWRAGVETCDRMYKQTIPALADLTIASAGGYPKDINMYQAQKALENADRSTRDGGIIILLAECSEGLGEKVFEEWMRTASKPEDVIDRIHHKFVIGGHKAFGIAKVAAKKEIILISGLSRETTEILFCKKMDSLEDALRYARTKLGTDYKMIVIPEAGLVKPYLEN